MNQSNDLLDKLDTQFLKLKDMQNGSVLSSVLLEYVKPDSIKVVNHIFSEDHPRKWRRIQTLGNPRMHGYKKEGIQVVYSSLVVPYKGNSRILTGTEDDTELPEGIAAVQEQLNLCLELAGLFLSRLTDRQSLPIEVSICENPSLSWLLLLHYITKPKRMIWTRIQRVDKDMDSAKEIGSFSFDVLQENSFSVIRDIAISSILAITQIKEGLLSPDQESPVNEVYHEQQEITFPPSEANSDNGQQEETYTLDQLAVKFAGYSNRNGFIKKSKDFGVTCDKDGPWTPSQAYELFNSILGAGGIQSHTKKNMTKAVSEWSKTL
ncbi:hypothetical protein [uncultured Gimesia sp.]|uniref:hypothetical protein n=1 Tax=uncultured Gimesia sp. TaxID=1678688 RepID=UPI002606B118|nr:hypothetical protein [uncultured Gimesia sp.]